ncbi:MAG: hypothetical protein ACK4Q5_11570 [Saprospiraceae bacterium]
MKNIAANNPTNIRLRGLKQNKNAHLTMIFAQGKIFLPEVWRVFHRPYLCPRIGFLGVPEVFLGGFRFFVFNGQMSD